MSEHPLFLDSALPEVRQEIDALSRAARSHAPVLLVGESGTGKTTLARWVHGRSRQSDGLFLPIHCPTVTDDASRLGCLGSGQTTLYLDQLGELPLPLQVNLLGALEQAGLGDPFDRDGSLRVIASMSQDPRQEIAAGRLHEDLFNRLDVVQVRLLPLRERFADLLPLAKHILRILASDESPSAPELSTNAQQLLLGYHWPGNIRELRNEIERALLVTHGDIIQAESLSERLRRAPRAACTLGGDFTLEEIERAHIERVLSRSSSFEAAARVLGIDISTLWRKRKRYERRGDDVEPTENMTAPMRVDDSDAA